VSPYIELHAASAFSFLRGASLPETLVEHAARLGYPALALLDRDGVYGAPRFHKAARAAGIRPIIGAELTVIGNSELGIRNSQCPIPNSFVLPILCETAEGYRNLCRLITSMKLRSPKGEGALTFDDLDGRTGGLLALVGRAALDVPHFGVGGLLDRVVGLFGRGQVAVEVQRHFRRDEEAANRALMAMASAFGVPVVATGGVRFATPADRPLFDVLTCIRHRTTLGAAGRRLAPNAERYLRSPGEMAALFADCPAVVARTRELADRLQYTMADLGYRFPDYPVPPGETQASFLRKITEVGALDRYRPFHDRARAQIARELDLIEKLDLAGYFLIVWDIVNFCRQHDILVQGRGSAANSAVCYSLGITAVDPVGMDLLFERFLSEERGEWPDIDLDLPSGERRERVIQHVYEKYGRHGAAMTANVITYRGRSATREVGRALAFDPAEIDRLARVINHFEFTDAGDSLPRHLAAVGLDPASARVQLFARLWGEMQDLPRHLGQHSGGMVICQGQLDAVVPLENASMPGRVVVQWDKDDCADMGIVKVDLLGLGMMAALQDTLALVNRTLERPAPWGVSPQHPGASAPSTLQRQSPAPWSEVSGSIDLSSLPPDDPAVYRLLCEADTVGVFQVESRAQMATLPRLKPQYFYDLVVQVAIIRPGPIVGQMVHPYLNRRAGREAVQYPHPSLEPILKRTLGVPLFQEQLLRIAMVAAGFTGGQAEELRRALGFKRSVQRMAAIAVRLREGMARRGITGAAADEIVTSIESFALYGFPESHAASFALLAYASAWFKVHYPAAFVTALLNNQPMGFYHPATLVKDAQRRGVRFHPVDVQASDWDCTIEADGGVRLGLRYVNGLREEAGRALAAARVRSVSPRQVPGFMSLDDLVARTGLRRDEMATLADIGALNAFGGDRRSALWQAERAVRPAGALYENAELGIENSEFPIPNSQFHESPPSPLSPMTDVERLVADYAGTGLTLGRHPMTFCRDDLALRGVLRAVDLRAAREGRRVRVAGMVITRQRPGTAKGFLFLTLEDETGVANVIVRPDLFARDRLVLIEAPFLLVDGILQNQEGVTSVRAEAVQAMPGPLAAVDAHDFH
jgi:error-prone DNA polymerase